MRAHGDEARPDRVAGREQRLPGPRPQAGDGVRIAAAHAGVDGEEIEAEVEQHAVAVLRPRRLAIGAEFCHHGAPVHGAGLFRQAERHGVVPARGDRGLVGDRTQVRVRPQGDGTASRGHPDTIVGQRGDGLVGVAHELRDRPEAAEAPGRARIAQRILQQRLDGGAVRSGFTLRSGLGRLGHGRSPGGALSDARAGCRMCRRRECRAGP